MIFLIDYDRRLGRIRSFRTFDDQERAQAEGIRLEMEILNRLDSEVVILEADSEAVVRKTHARYFETAAELLRSAADEATDSVAKG